MIQLHFLVAFISLLAILRLLTFQTLWGRRRHSLVSEPSLATICENTVLLPSPPPPLPALLLLLLLLVLLMLLLGLLLADVLCPLLFLVRPPFLRPNRLSSNTGPCWRSLNQTKYPWIQLQLRCSSNCLNARYQISNTSRYIWFIFTILFIL